MRLCPQLGTFYRIQHCQPLLARHLFALTRCLWARLSKNYFAPIILPCFFVFEKYLKFCLHPERPYCKLIQEGWSGPPAAPVSAGMSSGPLVRVPWFGLEKGAVVNVKTIGQRSAVLRPIGLKMRFYLIFLPSNLLAFLRPQRTRDFSVFQLISTYFKLIQAIRLQIMSALADIFTPAASPSFHFRVKSAIKNQKSKQRILAR